MAGRVGGARRAVLGTVALVAACSWPACGGAGVDDVLRVGFVTGEGGPEVGSNALRTRMLLAVMQQRHRALEAQLGFRFEVELLGRQGPTAADAERLVAESFAGRTSAPHVVVLNKERPLPRLQRLLGARCVLIALDVIDDLGSFAKLRAERGVLPADRALPRALALLQSDASIQHLRQLQAASPPLPAALSAWLALSRHQHTNVGGWRVRTPAEAAARPIRRVGILSGNTRHEPDLNATLELASRACLRGVRLVLINEHDKAGRATVLRTYGCDAEGRVALPPTKTHAPIWRGPTAAALRGGLRDSAVFNFSSQQKYHDVAWVDSIDVALLWLRAGMDRRTPSNFSQALFRPHTRLLHWWSHGVPSLFYPFASYVETAREVGYRTAGAGARLPLVSSPAQFSKLLRTLSREPESVRALAEAGLRGAARFSAERVCADLLRTLRAHVLRLRESCRPRLDFEE
jgi:hypothetical protein